jgi:hypothetical protein
MPERRTKSSTSCVMVHVVAPVRSLEGEIVSRVSHGVDATPSRPRFALWLDVGLKSALLVLLLVAVAWPDIPRFEGKAMAARAFAYPLAVLVVPFGWWLVSRHRPAPYPYAIDILWTLPFLIDTAGNAADLYDSIDWWDDLTHFVNWVILVAAFGQLLLRLPLDRLTTGALAVGFGAVTAILWEFAEYATFIRNSPERATAYTDTLGDLALGLSGSIGAALLTTMILWSFRPSASRGAGR